MKIAPRRLLLKYLNNLIPMNCENMTVGPKLWEAWGEEGQKILLKLHMMRKEKIILNLRPKSIFEKDYIICF